jgi:hypothetical protein
MNEKFYLVLAQSMGVLQSPFLSTSTQFLEGWQYLDSHYLHNQESQMTQKESSFLSDSIDPHNIQRQQILMLQWVLLCDYCSYFILAKDL